MAKVDLIMPKMGESIMEATILKWVKQEGDRVEMDETILEIATDKVDSEVPSPVDGVIEKILFQVDDTVEVGKVIAVIATEGESAEISASPAVAETVEIKAPTATPVSAPARKVQIEAPAVSLATEDERFYSPLVRSIAAEENIGMEELASVPGTGSNGRVTKRDILAYLKNRSASPASVAQTTTQTKQAASNGVNQPIVAATASVSGEEEIIQMDRMRKMIAKHMVMSKQTSPHVTSFVEVDVTNIVNWREANKKAFQKQYGTKVTYTPIFIEAVIKALHDFPMINVSVDGDNIIVKKNLNIGMATALPNGNLIVPVIKNADRLSLVGMASAVNDLAGRARDNKLKPEEVQGGTFTITNVGTFGNVMGTPIINQPQVAILAVGAIRKKPAGLEPEYGDVIAVRRMMFLSLSYDHRVVDGILGGSFLRRVGDYMESFDPNRSI